MCIQVNGIKHPNPFANTRYLSTLKPTNSLSALLVAPKWSIEPADTNIVRGTSTSIDCMATGFPPARIIWTKALIEPPAPGNSQQLQQQPSAGASAKTHHHHHHLSNWVSLWAHPQSQLEPEHPN